MGILDGKRFLHVELMGDYLKVFAMVAKRMQRISITMIAILHEIIEGTDEWAEIQRKKKEKKEKKQ